MTCPLCQRDVLLKEATPVKGVHLCDRCVLLAFVQYVVKSFKRPRQCHSMVREYCW